MTFMVKALSRLSICSQEKFITRYEIPVMQTVYFFNQAVLRTAHVARDQVPLRSHLQIPFIGKSRIPGSRDPNIQKIWRYEWDSSQRLLTHRSAG